MINFMILASNANNIADYFNRNSGGSIDIEHKYTSLQDNMSYIMNSNIRIDKFIIVMSEESDMNIKQEMTCLMNLIDGNAFFRVGEILVYAEENEYCSSGINYFKFVMNNLHFDNYTIKTYKDGIKIQSLYRDTLSILPPDENKTSYNVVYRVRKGEDSKVGYSPRPRNLTIVPKSRDGVSEYEDIKHNALKSESGRLITDIAPKEIIKVDFDLDLFKSNLSSIQNVYIYTGCAKSGTSFLCTSVAIQTDNTLVLDLSKNSGSYKTFKRLGDKVTYIDNAKLFLGEAYLDNGLKCAINTHEDSAMNLLKYIITVPNKLSFSNLFIDCDLSDLDSIVRVLQMKIKNIVFTCESLEDEFNSIKNYILKYSNYTTYLYLNECLQLDPSHQRVSPLQIKTSVPNCNVIKGENLYSRDLDLSVLV